MEPKITHVSNTDLVESEGMIMHKKRFLRLISAVLALSMLTALLPTAAFADGTGTTPGGSSATGSTPTPASKFTFSYDDTNNTASVTGFDKSVTEITIPATVEDNGKTYKITSIGDRAFQKCNSLASVTIPEGVTSIGNYTFEICSSLTSVTIPEGVTSIGERAFSECRNLTSVTIPEGVTSIGAGAFFECQKLASVTIPASVTNIGKAAFSVCEKMETVTFQESSQLKAIPDLMFNECKVLTSLTLPSGVTSIGKRAFQHTKLTSITIPEGVTSIGYGAFFECQNLESVTIPEGVTSIGEKAFGSCSSLTSVTIPASVTNIGQATFSGCEKLETVTFQESSQLKAIPDFMFNECEALTSLTLPSGITSIGERAFRRTKLTSITIPASVTSVASDIFDDCFQAIQIEFGGVEDQWNQFGISLPAGSTVTTYPSRIRIDPNGYPYGTNGGTTAFTGNGWEFEIVKSTYKYLKLNQGEFDFSGQPVVMNKQSGFDSTYINSNATVTGGDLGFTYLYGGTIKDGHFIGGASPYVMDSSTIENGVFEGYVLVYANNKNTKIEGGVFKAGKSLDVDTGTLNIEGGLFDREVKATGSGILNITGGIFTVEPAEDAIAAGSAKCRVELGMQDVTVNEYVTGKDTLWTVGEQKLTLTTNDRYEWKVVSGNATLSTNKRTKEVVVTVKGDSDVTLSAVKKEESGYTVKFDPNGKTDAAYMPTDRTVGYGDTITEPTPKPTVSNYLFDGWYKDTEGNTAFDFANDTVTENTTLYAKWTEKAELTESLFDFKDDELTANTDGVGTIVTTRFYKVGEDGQFTGEPLDTLENAKYGLYQADGTVTEGSLYKGGTLTSDKWQVFIAAPLEPGKPILYKIMVTGGKADKTEAKVGETVTLTADEPAEGELFDHWKVSGEKIEGNTFEMPAKDVTVKAAYTPKTYSVTFQTDHGTAPKAETVEHGKTIAAEPELNAEGHTFGGWYQGEEKFLFGENGTKVTENLTLTAKWDVNEYTVSFDANGHGTAPKAQTVAYKAKAAKLADLTAEGYTFGGWYTDKECRNAFDFETAVTGNVTLYAKWTEVKKPEPKPDPEPEKPVAYPISVDNGKAYLEDGETEINTAEAGQTVVVRVNPEAITEGFEFDKWEIVSGEITLDDETASEIKFTMPAGEVELKATVRIKETPAVPLTPLEQAMATTAEVAVVGAGVAAVGVAVYGIGTELAARLLLPAGAAMPATTGELALLLWKHAGSPALPVEAPLSETETALRWAVEQGILNADDPAEKKVSAMDVIRAVRENRK